MKGKRIVLKPKNSVLGLIFIIAFAIVFLLGITLLVFAKNSDEYLIRNGVIMYKVNNVKQLEDRLSLYKYLNQYPLQVEPYIVKNLPKDFATLPAKKRKKLFIRAILPIAVTVDMEFKREHLLFEKIYDKVKKHEQLSEIDYKIVNYGFKKYKCHTIKELLLRSGGVPVSLLIAQAGIESGWGKSRFAIQYNNIFGIHKKHPKPGDMVLKFKSLYDATKEYILNLDRSPAYKRFRIARSRMGDYPNPYKLAEYLTMYSTKRHRYIKLIQRVIAANELTAYDRTYIATPLAQTSLNQEIFE